MYWSSIMSTKSLWKISFALACLAGRGVPAQSPPEFEVASVNLSQSRVGHDGTVTTSPKRFTARNATMKRLIFEAWQIPYSQITNGPAWLDTDEFDIEAETENPVTPDQLRTMLRALLADRFRLKVRSEMKDRLAYVLAIDKGGPRLNGSVGRWRFHGDMSRFAGVLALQLTMSLHDDPTVPSHATVTGIPVIDKTGLDGVYDIAVDIQPDPGADTFTVWQRALQEQLGLKLQYGKTAVEFLTIDHVERSPGAN